MRASENAYASACQHFTKHGLHKLKFPTKNDAQTTREPAIFGIKHTSVRRFDDI